MPEMGSAFPNVTAVDPNDEAALGALLTDRIAAAPEQADSFARYGGEAARMAALLDKGYRKELARPVKRVPANLKLPSIAFVAPHYNHAEWVTPLLASLKPQLREGDEIILVDDCSPAPHAARARELAEAAGATFLSTAVNSGPSVARNLGARSSKAELLYFIDADDELAASSVEPLRRAFALNRELEVASGFMRAFNDENHYWASYDPIPGTILLENSSHCGIVIRRRAFERSGGYSEKLRLHIEDSEFHARLAFAGARFEILPLVTYRYRVNKKTGRDAAQPELRMRSYENVVLSALASTPEAQLPTVWREMVLLLPALLRRNGELEEFAARPPHLRYRIADQVNAVLKKAAVHKPFKKLLGQALKKAPR